MNRGSEIPLKFWMHDVLASLWKLSSCLCVCVQCEGRLGEEDGQGTHHVTCEDSAEHTHPV